LRIDLRHQQHADRHPDKTRHNERQHSPPFDRVPDHRQRLQLRHHRTEDSKRGGHWRRKDIEPQADGGERGAETGQPVDQAAGHGADEDDDYLIGSDGERP
jgi:hypothetical protein